MSTPLPTKTTELTEAELRAAWERSAVRRRKPGLQFEEAIKFRPLRVALAGCFIGRLRRLTDAAAQTPQLRLGL